MTLKQLNQLMTDAGLNRNDKNYYANVGLANGEVYNDVLLTQLTGMVFLLNVLWIEIYKK